MSHKKNRHVKPAKPHKEVKAHKFFPVIVAVILAGIPFVLGKYIELNSPGPFDSGAYTYSAAHLLHGARLGIDEVPSAQMGTLMVNVIGVKLFGYSDFGPKIIQGLMQLGALALMFYAMRKAFGSLAAIIGVVIASFYLSAPVIAKFGNVKEQFMIACMVTTASCFMIRQMKGKWFWQIFAGAAAVNIYYFKVTGITIITAILVYMLTQVILGRWNLKYLAGELTLLIAGAVAGLIPLAIFHSWQNQLTMFNKSVPAAVTSFAAVLTIIGFAVYYILLFSKRYHLIQQLRTVRPVIWLLGGTSIFAMLVVLGIYFAGRDEFSYFFHDVFFVKYPLKFVYKADAAWTRLVKLAESSRGYVGISRNVTSLAQQKIFVFGYYKVLILPIAVSVIAIIARIIRLAIPDIRKTGSKIQDRFVLLLGIWWFLDTAFVWISPRPYEQYYLPLNASAAMLGGYFVWLYAEKFKKSTAKGLWTGLGAVGLFAMLLMSSHVFFGLTKSPYSQTIYKNRQGQPERQRGYVQQLAGVAFRKKGNIGQWEMSGLYIRDHSNEDDTIYVWGWYPGIYVQAQRFCSFNQAFESNMHVKTPVGLGKLFERMLEKFRKQPPKFIVDTRKIHFPNDRPPLELWPIVQKGFMGAKNTAPLEQDENKIKQFEAAYSAMLAQRYGDDEAGRFKAMTPMRRFVMENYRIANIFGTHIILERKTPLSQPTEPSRQQ